MISLEFVQCLRKNTETPMRISQYLPTQIRGLGYQRTCPVELSARKIQENGENFTPRSFIICTFHIIKVIKSRIMRWTGHVARMGEMKHAYKMLIFKTKKERATWKS
jgi:hypothetical protein